MQLLLTQTDKTFFRFMTYNPNIHHRRSIRLKGYDYSQAGLYFLTICIRANGIRPNIFGNVIDGKMILNEAGKIVRDEWIKSAEIRKEIEIHEYVVMPNHFHAIVEIVGANGIRPNNNCPNENIANGICPNDKGAYHAPVPPPPIGSLVRGFKSSVSKQLGYSVWQRNYYEHIIRNEQSYQHIANYIINNPANWRNDKFHYQQK